MVSAAEAACAGAEVARLAEGVRADWNPLCRAWFCDQELRHHLDGKRRPAKVFIYNVLRRLLRTRISTMWRVMVAPLAQGNQAIRLCKRATALAGAGLCITGL